MHEATIYRLRDNSAEMLTLRAVEIELQISFDTTAHNSLNAISKFIEKFVMKLVEALESIIGSPQQWMVSTHG